MILLRNDHYKKLLRIMMDVMLLFLGTCFLEGEYSWNDRMDFLEVEIVV